MAAVTWLPGARKTPHGAALTYTDTGEPKGCLHTTETGRPSGYRGWKVPPHLEVEAIPGKGVNVQQFIPWTAPRSPCATHLAVRRPTATASSRSS